MAVLYVCAELLHQIRFIKLNKVELYDLIYCMLLFNSMINMEF